MVVQPSVSKPDLFCPEPVLQVFTVCSNNALAVTASQRKPALSPPSYYRTILTSVAPSLCVLRVSMQIQNHPQPQPLRSCWGHGYKVCPQALGTHFSISLLGLRAPLLKVRRRACLCGWKPGKGWLVNPKDYCAGVKEEEVRKEAETYRPWQQAERMCIGTSLWVHSACGILHTERLEITWKGLSLVSHLFTGVKFL